MNKLIGLLFVLLLSSCSANWHLNRALKKDPSLADRKPVIKAIKSRNVSLDLDPLSMPQTRLKYVLPRLDSLGRTDTVKVYINRNEIDTTKLEVEVDCPDPVAVDCPPILVKPTMFQKIKNTIQYTFIALVVGFFIGFFLRIIRR